MRYFIFSLLFIVISGLLFLSWLVSTPCGLDFSDDGYCEMTYIAQVSEEDGFGDHSCQSITREEFRNECYAVVARKNKTASSCLNIRHDRERMNTCLGAPYPQVMNENFVDIKDRLCVKVREIGLDEGFNNQWADSCMFLSARKQGQGAMCMRIKGHQLFYDCVRYVALDQQREATCSLIDKRMPFPENFTSPLFSVDGCQLFVRNGGQFGAK